MKISKEDQENYMKDALSLAEGVKGTTYPNPAVGAVIIRGELVVGRGATSPCGGPHAEVNAISDADGMAKGGIMFVTLEPCNHHGRTGPCTQAILDAGIEKVFVAAQDPNPIVSGTGIEFLRENGVEVDVGVLANDAAKMNEEFFYGIRTGMAWITVKLAMTLDGRIADLDNTSKWITGNDSRVEVHRLRSKHAAIAVGRTTIEMDDPQLDVRHVDGTSPIKIIFGSAETMLSNDFIKKYRAFENISTQRMIIVTSGGEKGAITKHENGLEIWYLGYEEQKERLICFREMAFTAEITSVFIEGGSKLASSFIENDQVNKLYLFYGNKILGGGVNAFTHHNPLKLSDALVLDGRKTESFGDDIMVSGYPKRGDV